MPPRSVPLDLRGCPSYSTSARAPDSPAPPACARSCRRSSPARSPRGDIGVDFDGTTSSSSSRPASCRRPGRCWSRRVPADRPGADPAAGRSCRRLRRDGARRAPVRRLAGRGRRDEWPGVIAGTALRAARLRRRGALFARARARLDGGAAALLNVYGDVHRARASRSLSILFPPLGFVALVGFLVLLVRGRAGGAREVRGPAHPA